MSDPVLPPDPPDPNDSALEQAVHVLTGWEFVDERGSWTLRPGHAQMLADDLLEYDLIATAELRYSEWQAGFQCHEAERDDLRERVAAQAETIETLTKLLKRAQTLIAMFCVIEETTDMDGVAAIKWLHDVRALTEGKTPNA